MTPLQLHPVDWYNQFGSFVDIFRGEKDDQCNVKSPTEVCYVDPDTKTGLNDTTYQLTEEGIVRVLRVNPHDFSQGAVISKFTLLSKIKFKGDYKTAESHVLYKLMKVETPYVRIGTKYYKVISKTDRWGGKSQSIKVWEKTAITDDNTKTILKHIPKYDDFCIVPDNKSHSRVHGDFYNLYEPFPHTPHTEQVTVKDIPHSMGVLRHIFGDQISLGLKYMKVLYEHPKQMMPVIVLVSKEKGTGKTTFLNWLYILFGGNVTTVNPENLHSEFNSSYAQKNILLFEEMFSDKSAAYHKIMALTTGKMITFRDLFVSGTSIPFFGKLIFCTNRVRDFMRIDSEENRFWIRYVKPVTGKKNIQIEDDLFNEVPKFLKYLEQLPEIDFNRDRLVFTLEETRTAQLDDVKEESKSGLYKELEIHIEDFFNNSDHDNFEATAKDIKEQWFKNDHKTPISYIRKVLTQEMELTHQPTKRYYPFMPDGVQGDLGKERIGLPFKFERKKL